VESLTIVIPQNLRFTCHMCSGCCRGWNVTLTDAEAERFKHHDWPKARPRMAGREIFEPAGEGRWHLSHIEDACIFLDEDNLCAIHKELGMDAKPLMCRQFPYHLSATPDGVVASLDFACPSVVANDGAPLDEQLEDVRAVAIEAQNASVGTETGGKDQAGLTNKPLQIRAGLQIAWADYLALEHGLIEVLEDAKRPLTERLLIGDRLVQDAGKHTAPGAIGQWIDAIRSEGWTSVVPTASPRVSPMRQRALIAWTVAIMEYAWAKQRKRAASVGSRLSMALAIVPGQKEIFLHTADAPLSLLKMRRTRFAQDDPQLNAVITRYLTAFIARKGLITGTTVRDGYRYLALYLGTIRWYSVARAVLAGRDAVEETDVRWALQLVERTLSHANELRSPRVTRFINLAFDHIAPPASLLVSVYPQ